MSTRCHRCNGERPAAYEFKVEAHDGAASWSCSLCEPCASIVCAAADGRPIFCRGSRAKYELGPRKVDPPDDWGPS